MLADSTTPQPSVCNVVEKANGKEVSEGYEDFSEFTMASLFHGPGERTPVFVRFSTVAGSRGSTDTPRDAGAGVPHRQDDSRQRLESGSCLPLCGVRKRGSARVFVGDGHSSLS
jgi:hypothetical protein